MFLYLKYMIMPVYDWPLIKLLMNSPIELAVKVRMYELLGADLETYRGVRVIRPGFFARQLAAERREPSR